MNHNLSYGFTQIIFTDRADGRPIGSGEQAGIPYQVELKMIPLRQ